jgi:hypothetical protein
MEPLKKRQDAKQISTKEAKDNRRIKLEYKRKQFIIKLKRRGNTEIKHFNYKITRIDT